MPTYSHPNRPARRPHRVALAACFAAFLLVACGNDERDRQEIRSASELYNEAKTLLEQNAYDRAVRSYRYLQTLYPFGRYAEQAQLEMAYAFYRARRPEQALATADRFIRMYPSHPNVDYAYYIRGLTNYEQKVGFLERIMPSRMRDRDQTAALEAFSDFDQLVRRFPDSRYAPDARQRMVFLRNNLSFYEIDVARYYLSRKAYVAAANRARYLLETYPNSPEAGNALEIMHIAYTELNLPELAADALRVLELNYPDHTYINDVKSGEGFWSRLWPFGE
ncbi:MAG: outer membrane protein assembly factor BamD [Xanthomonadales bacterium]|nr:outer membrane protein assembly factor BamD [Xanthomonadales bacterium]NIX13631.1 outer membrane protein assembly factor BamD [Xanthomonadales bacterium]